MREGIIRLIIIIGIIISVVFIVGLISKMISTADNYITGHPIIFSILVFTGIFYYLNKTGKLAHRNQTRPFILGNEYEKYENQLSDLSVIRIGKLEYVLYKYERKANKIYGLEVQKVWLAFNGDILQTVIYRLGESDFDKCLSSIQSEGISMSENPFECYQEAMNEQLTISLINSENTNYLCLGKQIVKQIIKPCKHKVS